MIGVIARISVKPDQCAAFEALIAELTAATRATEPGTLLYQLCKSRKAATDYTLMELYKDQASFDVHMSSDGFKAASLKMKEMLAGRPALEFVDAVGG